MEDQLHTHNKLQICEDRSSSSLVIERKMQKEMKLQENLSYINVIKLASTLLFGNINLVLFLFLCSLPLFCFLIFFELSLQTTISLGSQYLRQRSSIWEYYSLHQNSAENPIPLLIQVFLLYLFPYSLIDLLTTMTVVSASSIVYTSEEEPLQFRQLVWRTVEICRSRFGGCLTTSLYVLLLSTSVFFGFFFAATNYFYIIDLFGIGDYSYYYTTIDEFGGYYYETSSIFDNPVRMLLKTVMALFHGAIFIVLLANFSKWSAGWNMGLIISVLEEEEEEDGQRIYGSDALTLSAYFGRGHEKRGLRVMLVFLVFALAMRMPCLCFKCSDSSSGNGVLYTSLYVGLICVGNVIKWVACVVCYYDCRTRVLEKKGDMEIGSKAKAFATAT